MREVVSRYANLVQKNGRYWACCPFHNEKTPSFHIDIEKQTYYCFGCGKGGGLINFIMDAERMEFPEAVEFLARMYNMEVPTTESEGEALLKKRILAMNTEAARFFRDMLSTDAGAQARDYIAHRRLSRQTVLRFGLGYAPDSWTALTDHLRKKGYNANEMVLGGLAAKGKNNGLYDIFRHRLMFPIIDGRGNVIAFGGRVLSGDGDGQKYRNSSNTPVYSKKVNLYAYNIAKREKVDRLILVEGYMDAVSLHQAGFSNTVASLGTALTPDQARLISKITDTVVVCYDADRAGQAATERAIGILRDASLKVRILRIPGAKDPDDYIKEFGADVFSALLDKASDSSDYRMQNLKQDKDLSEPEQKVEYLKQGCEFLSNLTSAVELDVYASKLANETGVTKEAILAEVAKLREKKAGAERASRRRTDLDPGRLVQPPRDGGVRYSDPTRARTEEALISLVISHPELVEKMPELRREDFSSEQLGRLFFEVRERIKEGLDPTAGLEQSLGREEMSILGKINAALYPHENPRRELGDLLERMMSRRTGEGDTDPLLEIKQRKSKGYGG